MPTTHPLLSSPPRPRVGAPAAPPRCRRRRPPLGRHRRSRSSTSTSCSGSPATRSPVAPELQRRARSASSTWPARRPGGAGRAAADAARPAGGRAPAGATSSDDGAFEELVGAAWMAIRCCPVERRQAHVAANLVRDAAYRAFTAPTRRRSATRGVGRPAGARRDAGDDGRQPVRGARRAPRRGTRRRGWRAVTSTSSATSSGSGHPASLAARAQGHRRARSATTATGSRRSVCARSLA